MKKSFGQHFLTDKKYLQKILSSLSFKVDSTVLEIGAGSGILTIELAKQYNKVIAVEVERNVINKLKQAIKNNSLNNVEILEKSFLKLDLSLLCKNGFCVVGNIPYNISSKIITKLFGEFDKPACHLNNLNDVYLMLQYEVASRLIAKPSTKAYSPLSLYVQYFSEPEILFLVPSLAFIPKPKVNSAFVRLKPRKNLITLRDPLKLKSVIDISFQQRRKKVINPLSVLATKKTILRYFKENNIDENARAENLTFNDYIALSNLI